MPTRYARQARFEPIGEEGQRRIMGATAVVVGCGGLGTVTADILVRAGVGRVRIVDRDVVDRSNLQRQMLFNENDVAQGLPKAEAARRALSAVNPTVCIDARVADFQPANARELASGTDVLIDATDNREARYLLNDVAVADGIPWVYGAALGGGGVCAAFVPGRTPCLRCLYAEQEPMGAADTCDTAGILASTTHAVAALQCAAALRVLCGEPSSGHLVQMDVWSGESRTFDISDGRDPACPCCVQRQFDWLDAAEGSCVTVMCGRNAAQVSWRERRPVALEQVAARLRRIGEVTCNEFLLRFDDGDVRLTLFADGRAILDGVTDAARARTLYSRYVG